MTWPEYITLLYLAVGLGLAVYYAVHDVRQRCVPEDAIMLIPLIPFGWPYTVWVLARERWRQRQVAVRSGRELEQRKPKRKGKQ